MHYLERELVGRLNNDGSLGDFLGDLCPDGLWIWDLDAPENEWLSDAAWRLFGHDPDPDRRSPQGWRDLVHPDELEATEARLRRFIENPDAPYDGMVRYVHAEGRDVWVRCRAATLCDDTGRVSRLLGTFTDLTDLITRSDQREMMGRALNARLSAVFNAAQSGIVGLDENRNVVMLNPPARHILGGLSLDTPFAWPGNIRFLQGDDLTPLDASSDPINRTLAGSPLSSEVHLMSRSSTERAARYVRFSSALVDEPESGVRAVIVLDDVSEQERNRQQVERQGRLDALGQLTGGIAHDFNNLLATILYAVDLASKEPQTDRSRRLLSGAMGSVERGRQLTNRLLAFAKQQPSTPSARTLRNLLADFEVLVRPVIEEQIELKLEIPAADLAVFCDQSQLENALLNLVLNSRDAIMRSASGSRITISTRDISDAASLANAAGNQADARSQRSDTLPRHYVEISVSDDGPGMSPEIRRRATDPFFTTKGESSGSGLGLSMVYGFVQKSDGLLQIYSEENLGTTVRVILPGGDSTGLMSEGSERGEAVKGRGETVLLVEDEEFLLMMMTETLEELGYGVEIARSGAEAWEMLRNGLVPDAIVSDVVMPGGVGGFDLVQRAQRLLPGIPAVLLSGYVGYTMQERSGTEAVILQKPCMPEELAQTLRDALEARPG